MDELKHLKTIKEKVFWIYSNSKDAVDSNDVLISLFVENFGQINESVIRAGRFFRSEKAGSLMFHRSPAGVERDSVLTDLNKSYWGKVQDV